MAITSNDIKLMQSERLTEESDGGGQMTGLPVIDGDINNLFEDISRVDRTYGDVSLRKAFLKVDTATADLYLDAHAILSAQPQDPNVSALLFTTEDFYDQRAAARSRIESFVVPGPVTGLHLRGTQLSGQRSLIVYAPKLNSIRAPEIGETYMLRTGDNVSTQQFVKVVNVITTNERFTYAVSGADIRTFDATQYVLQLSSELQRDYPANDPSPAPSNTSRLYSTQPANSAKYYGTSTLKNASLAGATSIRVAETFAPIIPTASSETPVIDQRPGGFLSQVIPSSNDAINISVNVASGATSQLPTAIVPGSMSLTVGGTAYTDKGAAFVTAAGSTGTLEGTVINYRSGLIAWAGSQVNATVTLTYKPGALRQQLPNTGRIEIDDTNRNFNYVLTLDPPPAPTTFNAAYQYLGKWYELNDDGTGLLIGDGSGQVNYITGSVVLTLEAQPDASSVIFFRWTEGAMYSNALGQTYSDTSPVNLSLSNGKVVPGSVSISWEAGAGAKTASDVGGEGIISGDATGTIDYAAGRISLTATSTPVDGWTINYTHKNTTNLTSVVAIPANTNRADITLTTAPNIQPGSINFDLIKSVRRVIRDSNGVELSASFVDELYSVRDNGNGNIIAQRLTSEAIGFVNYATGVITIVGTAFLKIRSN